MITVKNQGGNLQHLVQPQKAYGCNITWVVNEKRSIVTNSTLSDASVSNTFKRLICRSPMNVPNQRLGKQWPLKVSSAIAGVAIRPTCSRIESVDRVTLDGGGVPKMAVDRDSHTIVQLCQRTVGMPPL